MSTYPTRRPNPRRMLISFAALEISHSFLFTHLGSTPRVSECLLRRAKGLQKSGQEKSSAYLESTRISNISLPFRFRFRFPFFSLTIERHTHIYHTQLASLTSLIPSPFPPLPSLSPLTRYNFNPIPDLLYPPLTSILLTSLIIIPISIFISVSIEQTLFII